MIVRDHLVEVFGGNTLHAVHYFDHDWKCTLSSTAHFYFAKSFDLEVPAPVVGCIEAR